MRDRVHSKAAGGRWGGHGTLGVMLLVGAISLGASGDPLPEAPGADPCTLLEAADILTVQQVPVAERVGSRRSGTRFDVRACFYRTVPHSGSVSLVVALPTAKTGDDGVGRYWTERFHPAAGFPEGKRQPPDPIDGLGEEAFWVGDPVAGSLYVLAGEVFLRISVGGAPDAAARRERSVALARRALPRIDEGSGVAGRAVFEGGERSEGEATAESRLETMP
ncbi:MAG: hypothetical protein R3244_10535 [Thermoanaerobaculia bacterium]|nr:hypothetical protein [Thermoanaerobaculia bacterium]